MLERNSTEKFDYKGFIVKRGDVMGSLKFSWGKAFKKSGSIMIGTSPEYDMALFTMCFLSRRGRELCQVYIGTVYPTAGKMTDSCGRT
ncbi:unnamed protein product [Strongylus vulgaris]|uniref:EndoU domain-containing protein n=1 Tax=Strongylus vulgaris TaxID=40348 RepID=A0A3P7LUS0_STRVU|nr:unnamed protein product [Strongylus vulgaris]